MHLFRSISQKIYEFKEQQLHGSSLGQTEEEHC